MNIALFGYGKMGREIEDVAKEKGIAVVKVLDVKNNLGAMGITKESMKGVDVCIDFSTPASVLENIEAAVGCGKNLVVGTTGWYDRLDNVRKLVKENKTGFLYSPNFSLGVNIFMQVVLDAAHLFDRYPEYDVAISETHHRGKADSPSGTAIALGTSILQTLRRKTELATETAHGSIKPHQLHVTSTRVGAVPGKHAVVFDSDFDCVELVHQAKGRRGFAVGALAAAEWLKGKKGFYTMRDVILP